jgi:required for meiotic nuclear division protein 1
MDKKNQVVDREVGVRTGEACRGRAMTAVLMDNVSDAATAIVSARALFVGERIDTRALEHRDSLATAPLTLRTEDGGTAVLFRYGAVVLFNVSRRAEEAFIAGLAPVVIEPFPTTEVDEVRIQIIGSADEQVDLSGTIFLKEASIGRFQVIADILAKSLILAHYETRLAGVFDSIEPLAATLRAEGRPGARGRDLMRQIGGVLAMQHKMVGRVETGERPELIWEHPELGRLYDRLADEYELRDRDRALDRKLEIISRTVETLLGLVQSRSSLRVEWYILALIVAELVWSAYPLLLPG